MMSIERDFQLVDQSSVYFNLIKIPEKIANQYVDCREDHWRFTFDRDED